MLIRTHNIDGKVAMLALARIVGGGTQRLGKVHRLSEDKRVNSTIHRLDKDGTTSYKIDNKCKTKIILLGFPHGTETFARTSQQDLPSITNICDQR